MRLLVVPFVAEARLCSDWEDPQWSRAPLIHLSHFRPEGSAHRPGVGARLVFSHDALHGIFLVEDRYVLSRHIRPGDPVYRDSCVEFFVRPRRRRSYFHFEWNAGGTLLAGEVFHPERTPTGFREARRLTEGEMARVAARSSLPAMVEPEATGPLTWRLGFTIPFELLGTTPKAGERWRGNFFKCGDATSHPHWASWTALPERNFHLPGRFGALLFER